MSALTPRTTTTLVAALMAATLTASCGDDPVEATVPTTVTVSPASVSLQSLDETVQLTATVKDQNGQAMPGIAVAWTSSDPAVGTVDDSGLVTAVGNGTVTVTATAGSASGSTAVTVDQIPADVAVAPDSLALGAIGDTARVEATFVDANGHAIVESGAQWASTDRSVATVDASGLVTAVTNGTVVVTATAGSVAGSVAVTVDQLPTEVLVAPATDTLVASGDTLRLSADAFDSNGNAVAGAVFVWASTDTLVAVVDDEGLVTGVSAGEVEVTATSEGSTGRAQLTVAAPVPSTVTISPDTVAFHALGQTERLVAEVRDQIGRLMEGETVSWSSADTLIATVDSAGRVTATGGGATTVAATAGSATATAVMTVTQAAGSVVISPPAATIALGDTLRLSAEAFDENGHVVADAEFDWSSSDLSVVRVDEFGLATAVGEGRATVTAVADGARGTAEITVENPDRAALVALYNATDGPNWVDNTNWLTDAPLGEWYGVDTDTFGRVVWVELTGSEDPNNDQRYISHGLSGSIPPALGNLGSLIFLSLRKNNLSGPIPSELGSLRNLSYLSLSFNNLSGEIPPEMGDLANLSQLRLHGNNLSGSIPSELAALSQLQYLGLAANDLSGPIPSDLGKLANLTHLGIEANYLTGEIPPELGDLSNLQSLSLNENRLSGTLPPELGNLTKLTSLSVHSNDFVGSVPRTFLNLSLRQFGAFCGYLNVCVPGTSDFVSWLQGIDYLEDLHYCSASDQAALSNLFEAMDGDAWAESDGWLDGPALEEWHGVQTDSLGFVTALHLSDNGLSGALHNDIGRLTRLSEVRLDDNALGGRLPFSLTSLDLREFHYADTELCEPADDGFRKWLDGIDSLQGTGVGCTPLGDRDVLEAVYRSTGGGAWRKSRNWLSDKPLGQWHGVEVDDEGQVVRLELRNGRLRGSIPPELGALTGLEVLDLAGNDLSGSIPPDLGDLSRLSRLNLEANDLSGSIPSELGDLAEVDVLDLGSNRLSGPIPPELGDLVSLRTLDLSWNDFSGPIPPELGALADLSALNLGWNELSGAIPPELGNLTDLQLLIVAGNELSGAIPSELGILAHLWKLDLSNNDLSGPVPPQLSKLANLEQLLLVGNRLSNPIPPELGDLASLWRLDLSDNDLSGTIPGELGDLVSLRRLYLSQNSLSGAIPSSFGELANLEELLLAGNGQLVGALPKDLADLPLQSLLTGGTDLCAPSDRDFQVWLATIPKRWIANCGEAMAYLVQAVQSRTHPVPLVAGEGAMLRVFVTARKPTSEVVPPVRGRFYLDGTERHVVEIPAGTSLIPTDVTEGERSESANADIPGHIVRPGLEMVVEIDPDSTLDPALGVPKRIPETGRMAMEVRSMPTLDITAIPFLWSGDPDLTVVEAVEGMAADPDGHEVLEDTRILLPVRDIDVTAHQPVFSASNNAFDLLTQTEALRVLEDGRGHYVGMMSGKVSGGAAGVAMRPGRSSFSVPRPGVVAHELGHNMGLGHAPCGRPPGLDLSFPDPFGAIAAWGHDSRSGTLVSPRRPDLMSYCHPQWISGYHFANALAHRLKDEAASDRAATAVPTTSLLLWGGVDPAGIPFLNPAFVADAPAALPDSAGDHTLTGRDAAGDELFSLSFAMPEIGDGGGQSGFVFVLPANPSWEASLASITLSGPDGSFTLDGATDAPMAILRNPATGQIRGFLRDLPQETQAAMDAAGRAVEPGLEVLFSRGIPAASEWRR